MLVTRIAVGLLSVAIVDSSLTSPTNGIFESVRQLPEGWTEVGIPNPETRIHLRIALDHQKQALFEETLLNVSTPGHPQYGQHLSRAELKALLKPQEASTNSILSWLQNATIPAADINDDGEWISFNATVSKAEQILSTKFYVYMHSVDKMEMIRTLEYSLPSSVSQHIITIQPTTRFSRMWTKRNRTSNAAHEIVKAHKRDESVHWTSVNATYCNTTITPECLRDLYNIGDYQANAKPGSLFGVAGYMEQYPKYADLQTFLEVYAPYAVGQNFSVVGINGGIDGQNSTLDDGEASLDIQYAVPLSYKVPVVYYITGGRGPTISDLNRPDQPAYASEPYLEFLTYMLKLDNKELPQTLSISYGEDEQSWPPEYARTVCNMFGQLGARGVSTLFASGDDGVGFACQTNDGKNTTRFLSNFPASCPWVTAVGGTWEVEPERAMLLSSGGFSDLFPRPKYQDAAVLNYLDYLGDKWKGLYNPNGRGIPDVAAQYYNFTIFPGKTRFLGGTSASAPTFSAVVALLNNARLSANLPPLGFLNPWIYSGGYKSLNDIVVGNSIGCLGVDLLSGLPTPFVANASWQAIEGWDPVTGYGTPNFKKMLELSTPGAPWNHIENPSD